MSKSIADEIAKDMQSSLVKTASGNMSSLLNALTCLNSAADIFDQIGMDKESGIITKLIENFVKSDV